MMKHMKQEKFEQLLGVYGADIKTWPKQIQPSAQSFASTDIGQLLVKTEEELDELFSAGRSMGPELASDGNADAFIERLDFIPDRFSQELNGIDRNNVWSGFSRNLSDVFNFSSVVVAGQALALAAILFVGVTVGMQPDVNVQVVDVEANEVDISETWFASSENIDDLE